MKRKLAAGLRINVADGSRGGDEGSRGTDGGRMGGDASARVVKAVHGVRRTAPDPAFEVGLSEDLRARYGREGLVELYGRFCDG